VTFVALTSAKAETGTKTQKKDELKVRRKKNEKRQAKTTNSPSP